MRFFTLMLVALLTACTPPASQPPADSPAAQSAPSTANTAPSAPSAATTTDSPLAWADVANDPQLIGHWRGSAVNETGNPAHVAFGDAFSITCPRRGELVLTRAFSRPLDLPPGAATTLNILTPAEDFSFPAQTAADGAPRVIARVNAADPRLDQLSASSAGFAVQTAGDTSRLRHDEVVANVIAGCRG